MPQLDTLTYISSLFWIMLTFLVYYILYVKEVLPNVSSVLKIRNSKEGVINRMVLKNEKKKELLSVRYCYVFKIYRKLWD
jgi:hypothetical protein